MFVIINVSNALGIHMFQFFMGWFLVLVKIQSPVHADEILYLQEQLLRIYVTCQRIICPLIFFGLQESSCFWKQVEFWHIGMFKENLIWK